MIVDLFVEVWVFIILSLFVNVNYIVFLFDVRDAPFFAFGVKLSFMWVLCV